MAPPARKGHAPAGLRAYFLLAGLGLFWGLSWPIMKVALSEIPPWTFRMLSLTLGGAGVLAMARLGGHSLSVPRTELGPLVLVALLNVTGWHLGSAHGLSMMMAGRAVIIGFTMPLWAALLSAVILKEPLTPRKNTGLLLGLTGLGILIYPDFGRLEAAPLGVLFMLGAGISWAAGTVMLKRFTWSMPVIVLTGWQLSLGSLPVVVGTLLFEPTIDPGALSLQVVLAMIYVVAFPMWFCHWAWFSVVEIFPASIAAIGTLSVPVIGVISSILVLDEALVLTEWRALLVVVAALRVVMLGLVIKKRHDEER
jgi:drug/metabolite transporter (DMT)-like permease